MEEVRFFDSSTVVVTLSRFIVASKVFEIKNISSVRVGIIKGYTKIKFVLMLIGFLLMFFNDSRMPGIVVFFVAFLSLYFAKKKFSVRISTDSGETDCLISKDEDYIERVVKAINLAMWAQYSAAYIL